jgi:hypothetical protein
MGQYKYITWYIEPNNLNKKKTCITSRIGSTTFLREHVQSGYPKKDPQFLCINSLLVPCVRMTHWALVLPARQQSIPMRHARLFNVQELASEEMYSVLSNISKHRKNFHHSSEKMRRLSLIGHQLV